MAAKLVDNKTMFCHSELCEESQNHHETRDISLTFDMTKAMPNTPIYSENIISNSGYIKKKDITGIAAKVAYITTSRR